MHFLRPLLQSSLLRFLTFLLSAIVLVPFDTPKTALAIGRPRRPGPPGADPRLPTPLICDYPNDDAIRLRFTAPGSDETVVFADLDVPGDGQVAEYCALYDRKWIYDCFPTGYLVQGLRSRRWLIDFYYRFNVIYLQAAQGWVYLLSRADGPREELAECSFWFQVQFTTLRMNPNVLAIAVVNVLNYNDWWIYWMRGDGDQPRRRPTPSGDDDGNGGGGNQRGNGNGNGNSGSTMNSLGGIVSTGLTNLGTNAGGFGAAAWRAFWGNGKDPTAPAGDDSKDRKDQTDPGIKTDVLNLKIGELPDLPVGIDEKSTIAASDPTSVTDSTLAADNFKPNDETSSVNGDLNIDESLENPTTATSGKLFGRSHRIIYSRADVGFCNGHDWFEDPSIADFTSYKAMQERPETPASSYGLLYNLVPGALATILITQYKKEYDSQQQSVGYHLDITVLDPASEVLFGGKRIYAPSGQEITVNANLNFLLYVKVDDKDENPISIRYGNPLIFNTVNGAQWDSNDQSQEHRCVTDPKGPWEDKRQIMCLFKN